MKPLASSVLDLQRVNPDINREGLPQGFEKPFIIRNDVLVPFEGVHRFNV